MHSKGVQRDLGPRGARERAERAACREKVVICMWIVAERTELGLIRHFLPGVSRRHAAGTANVDAKV